MKTVRHIVPGTVRRNPINFHIRDKYKRALGCLVMTCEAEFAIAREMHVDHLFAIHSREPGVYFVADVQATRSGSRFGKVYPQEYFASHVDRDKYVAERINEFRLRALR